MSPKWKREIYYFSCLRIYLCRNNFLTSSIFVSQTLKMKKFSNEPSHKPSSLLLSFKCSMSQTFLPCRLTYPECFVRLLLASFQLLPSRAYLLLLEKQLKLISSTFMKENFLWIIFNYIMGFSSSVLSMKIQLLFYYKHPFITKIRSCFWRHTF